MPQDPPVADPPRPAAPRAFGAELAVAMSHLEPDAALRLEGWATQPRYRAELGDLTTLLGRLHASMDLVAAGCGAGPEPDGSKGMRPSGAPDLAQRLALAELADAFAGDLPIGTGGRRGPVGPGPNRMNSVVVRETALGLANALPELSHDDARRPTPRVAIVYDTRVQSRPFAWLAAVQLAAVGVDVLLVDEPRSTPLLSFTVRRERCDAGIVVSASHNPPGDNGMKIYGSDGAQVIGQRDAAVMREIRRAATLELLDVGESLEHPEALQAALARGATERPRPGHLDAVAGPRLTDEIDGPYLAHVLQQGVSTRGAADTSCKGLRVIFSALHGVGAASVVPVLTRAGAEVVAVAQLPDGGHFSTVASANPELPAAFEISLQLARRHNVPLVIACDPDADRLGAMVLHAGDYRFLDGNQLGVLMLEHVTSNISASAASEGARRVAGEGLFVATTLVTSPLIGKIARTAGLEVVDDLLVGFKHHAGLAAERGDVGLAFACEESHGYLRGDGVRDKDGAIAALLLAQLAATLSDKGQTLIDQLHDIWRRYGAHVETTVNIVATGVTGRAAIALVMDRWRSDPPERLNGWSLVDRSDRSRPRHTGSAVRDLPGNVLEFAYELSSPGVGPSGDGEPRQRRCRLVLRPSGTEPKLKVYALASAPPGGDEVASHAALTVSTLTLLEAARNASSVMMELR